MLTSGLTRWTSWTQDAATYLVGAASNRSLIYMMDASFQLVEIAAVDTAEVSDVETFILLGRRYILFSSARNVRGDSISEIEVCLEPICLRYGFHV